MASGTRGIVQEAEKCKVLAESSQGVPEGLVASSARVVRLLHQYKDYVGRMASNTSPAINSIVNFTQTNDWQEFGRVNSCHTMNPRMMTGHEEAQLLRMLVSMSGATRVLEIGMFTGCAALAMAEVLPSNGTVVTCELNPALEKVVRDLVDKSPHGKKINIRIGPALDTLAFLLEEGRQFDFVFIDADKVNYINYYKFLLDNNLLAPGGTICVDNVLWGGDSFILEEEVSPDAASTHGIRAFNQAVLEDERVYQVLLPNRDGILVVRRKADMDLTK